MTKLGSAPLVKLRASSLSIFNVTKLIVHDPIAIALLLIDQFVVPRLANQSTHRSRVQCQSAERILLTLISQILSRRIDNEALVMDRDLEETPGDVDMAEEIEAGVVVDAEGEGKRARPEMEEAAPRPFLE